MVDYQEGAGGEFIARFISAHFGHRLEFDQQTQPDHIQKWLNSHSLITQDWDENFATYLDTFLSNCDQQGINDLAVPYHLYKWPNHVKIMLDQLPQTRFVKINCETHNQQVNADFQRKVLDKPIIDFQELQFLLSNRDRNFITDVLKLYQQKKLTYRDIVTDYNSQLKSLPSSDIEIIYSDFFCDFDRTADAYKRLCSELTLPSNDTLISALLDRNKKNKQDLDKHLSKT